MPAAYAILSLIRYQNLPIFFLGTLLGGYLFGGERIVFEKEVWILAFAGLFLAGAANAFNDVVDIEIDRINKPHRVLPSGALQPKEALQLWGLFTLLGLGLCFAVKLDSGVIGMFGSLVIVFYSLWFKRQFLIGNLFVSLDVSLMIVLGSVAAPDFSLGVFLRYFLPIHADFILEGFGSFPHLLKAANASYIMLSHSVHLAFLITLFREIVKDHEDRIGDFLYGGRTLALQLGERGLFGIYVVLTGLCITVALCPFFGGFFPIWYSPVMIPSLGCIIGAVVISKGWNWAAKTSFSPEMTRHSERQSELSRMSVLLKFSMLFGILGLAAGRFFLERH